jgi:hypothetical protein
LKTIDAKDLRTAALPERRACTTAEPTAERKAPRTAALPESREFMMAGPMVALTAEPMAEPTAMGERTAGRNR